MTGTQSAAVPALRDRMAGDYLAVFKDPNLIRMALNLNDTFSGRVRYGVEIAADRDHAFMTDAPFHRENGIVRMRGQGCQTILFFGESLVDHPVRGGMHPGIGYLLSPCIELDIQILHVPERSAEKEVLADIAVGPFDFSFRLGPVGLAGSRRGAIVVQQSNQSRVVGDNAIGILSKHRGFHTIVENLSRCAATGVKGRDVAAQDGLKLLVRTKAPPEPTTVTEDHAKEPDFPPDARLVGKLKLEFSEVHLRLVAWRRFKPSLEQNLLCQTGAAQKVRNAGIAALVAEFADLPEEPAAGKIGKLENALPEITFVGRAQPAARFAWAVVRRLKTPFEIFPHRLTVQTRLARDRAYRQTLSF